MGLAGFCRNCLADWVMEAQPELSKDKRAPDHGMPPAEWKAKYQSEATPGQLARMEKTAKNAAQLGSLEWRFMKRTILAAAILLAGTPLSQSVGTIYPCRALPDQPGQAPRGPSQSWCAMVRWPKSTTVCCSEADARLVDLRRSSFFGLIDMRPYFGDDNHKPP
jgi:hypothetical protein